MQDVEKKIKDWKNLNKTPYGRDWKNLLKNRIIAQKNIGGTEYRKRVLLVIGKIISKSKEFRLLLILHR